MVPGLDKKGLMTGVGVNRSSTILCDQTHQHRKEKDLIGFFEVSAGVSRGDYTEAHPA